ncbi:hypothetical protein EGR_06895 [Echinococcus granulosus]|uniref:Uncharacterized protein n=1 Tax=Echinococcus granulosus TaxID=6210 RepID=W6UAZ2_ECHGR|nr:hypothetical protein EGR_06895 [Echinococcus granulosus]EUB58260.1 hypothetical protein EGR_06895 [Echinococcus granulosus]
MPVFLVPSEAAFNARFARPLLATRDSKTSAQLQRAGDHFWPNECGRAKLYETFSKTLEGQEALKYLLAVCNHPSLALPLEHPLYDWALEHCTDKSAGLDDFHKVHTSCLKYH